MSTSEQLIYLLLVVTLVLGVLAVAVFIGQASRMRTLRGSSMYEDTGGDSGFRRLERYLFTRRPLQKMATLLKTAGLNWSPLLCLILVLGVMVLIMVAGPPLLGQIGAVLVALPVPFLFLMWIKRKAAKRGEAFIAQLPELARIVANGNAAGLSMRRCIAMAGREMAEPAGGEMKRVAHRLDVGWTVDQALTDLSERLPSRELNVLVRTIVVQARTGGALTGALLDIAKALDDRKELRREVATVILGSSVSGYAVILIGMGAVVLLNVLQPGLIDEMATNLIGQIVLIVSASLFGIGLVMMRVVSRVEV